MKIYFQLIQNYLNQQIPTIILTIEKQKYIFNMASCFQRFIKDHKQKFPVGSRIFFTKVNTDTLAGLSGFMLTIFENKACQDTKLYVNSQMYQYLQQIRYKMGFKMLPYSYTNFITNQTRTGVQDINTAYQMVQKPNFPQIFLNCQSYIKQNLTPQKRNQSSKFYYPQINQFNDGDIKIRPFQIQVNSQKLINYILIPNKLQGKVLMNKIKQHKVPPQMISKLLSQGKLILQNKQQVLAEWIKQPDQPSPNFIILQYNCIQAVKMVINHSTLLEYLKNKQNHTNSVIHIVQNPLSNQRIVESDAFRYLLNMFDPINTTHLIYNRHYRNQNYTKQPVPKHIELVSFVHKHFPTCMPDVFNQYNNYINEHWNKCKILSKQFPENKVIAYKRCHQFILAPKKSQGYFAMDQTKNKQKQKKQFYDPENVRSLNQLKQIYKQELPYNLSQQQLENNNSEVVFLGTGSMKPSKYRNVSSIYIQLSEHNSLLLDCGEGSYYQLFNHYGKQKIDKILLNIKSIFITHIHSDHNLGILDLISQRNKLLKRIHPSIEQINKNKLFLIIPYNVLPWFDSYVRNIENLLQGCQVVFIQSLIGEQLNLGEGTVSKDQTKMCKQIQLEKNQSQMKDQKQQAEQILISYQKQQQNNKIYFKTPKQLDDRYKPIQEGIYNKFKAYLHENNITKFLPVHVDHCPQSFAIVIEHKSGVKISYSGDCRPSLQFAKQAHRSTLLIHQATFGDDLQNNAKNNMHSTVGQAIDIAMTSQSWKLALTHFSQRYVSAKQIVNPSLYKFEENKKNYAENHSIVCFDHLRMRMTQLPFMPYLSRKICEIFPSDSQE